MKKRTGRWRRLAALCLGIGLLAAGSLPAAAKSGEIRVQLKELGAENSSREGVEVELYPVGRVDAFGKPSFDPAYGMGDYPQNSQELDAAAGALSGLVTGAPGQSGKTDGKGRIAFSVEEGVYLIRVKGEERYGTVKPFLINLPYYEEVNGELRGPLYEVEAEPKAAPPEAVVTPKPTETPKPTVPPKPTGTPGGGAETGEDSGIAWYSALAALALLGSGAAWYRRRRHV